VAGMGGPGELVAGQRPDLKGVLEDRLGAAVGVGAQVQGAGARRLGAPGSVPAGEADDAQRGAVALLGMRPCGQDRLDECRRCAGGPASALAPRSLSSAWLPRRSRAAVRAPIGALSGCPARATVA
jgi:hypothetical protein